MRSAQDVLYLGDRQRVYVNGTTALAVLTLAYCATCPCGPSLVHEAARDGRIELYCSHNPIRTEPVDAPRPAAEGAQRLPSDAFETAIGPQALACAAGRTCSFHAARDAAAWRQLSQGDTPITTPASLMTTNDVSSSEVTKHRRLSRRACSAGRKNHGCRQHLATGALRCQRC